MAKARPPSRSLSTRASGIDSRRTRPGRAKGDLFSGGGVVREAFEKAGPQSAASAARSPSSAPRTPRRSPPTASPAPCTATSASGQRQLSALSTVVVPRPYATVAQRRRRPRRGRDCDDGQGGTLVPGLHDIQPHQPAVNLFNPPSVPPPATRQRQRPAAGDDGRLNAAPAGPRIVRNGFLEGRSPYSARNGFIADTLPQALDDVHWYADHGYWQIKIYNPSRPTGWLPVAAEAHRLGMGVTGHVPASPRPTVIGTATTTAHINQLMLADLDPGEDTPRRRAHWHTAAPTRPEAAGADHHRADESQSHRLGHHRHDPGATDAVAPKRCRPATGPTRPRADRLPALPQAQLRHHQHPADDAAYRPGSARC